MIEENISLDDREDIKEFLEKVKEKVGKERVHNCAESLLISHFIFQKVYACVFPITDKEELQAVEDAIVLMFAQSIFTYPEITKEILNLQERFGELLNLKPTYSSSKGQ